jgi:hypothetical protein
LLKPDQLSVDDTLQYLILCDRYRFDDLKERLVQPVESAGISQHKIVESWFYGDVDSKLMRDILHKKLNQATATIAQRVEKQPQPCGRCNYSINSGCGTHVEQLKAAKFDIGQLEKKNACLQTENDRLKAEVTNFLQYLDNESCNSATNSMTTNDEEHCCLFCSGVEGILWNVIAIVCAVLALLVLTPK